LITSFLGGGPDGGTTFGLVFSAVGSGVVLVEVLVVVVLVAVALAVVTAAAVSPEDGASWTPGAAELPHPARTAASAIATPVNVIGLNMAVCEGSESALVLLKNGI
jgi:hypothetical protein